MAARNNLVLFRHAHLHLWLCQVRKPGQSAVAVRSWHFAVPKLARQRRMSDKMDSQCELLDTKYWWLSRMQLPCYARPLGRVPEPGTNKGPVKRRHPRSTDPKRQGEEFLSLSISLLNFRRTRATYVLATRVAIVIDIAGWPPGPQGVQIDQVLLPLQKPGANSPRTVVSSSPSSVDGTGRARRHLPAHP